MAVACGQLSMMKGHGALGDRQHEADASLGPVAVTLHTEKRLEDVAQHLFGDAWATVAHSQRHALRGAFHLDFDLGALWCMANGVAQNVLNGAAEEFRVTLQWFRGIAPENDAAAAHVGLDRTLIHYP